MILQPDSLDFTRWLLANELYWKMFLTKQHDHTLGADSVQDGVSIFAKSMIAKMSSKSGSSSLWNSWLSREVGIDISEHSGSRASLSLQSRSIEMLGVSMLEMMAHQILQHDKLGSREDHITLLTEKVVQNLVTGDRLKKWSLDCDGAPRGILNSHDQFWQLRAAVALDAASKPGVVLSRVVEPLSSNTNATLVTWCTGSIFTNRNNQSDIVVSKVHSASSNGGARIDGTSFYSSLEGSFEIETSQSINYKGVLPSSIKKHIYEFSTTYNRVATIVESVNMKGDSNTDLLSFEFGFNMGLKN